MYVCVACMPDDDRPLPKHVGVCILNKGVVQFSACVGCFRYIHTGLYLMKTIS
jgi:hypothetical protein